LSNFSLSKIEYQFHLFVGQVKNEANIKFISRFKLSEWTNSFVEEFEKRDIYIGVVSKDLFWLESSAVPLIE